MRDKIKFAMVVSQSVASFHMPIYTLFSVYPSECLYSKLRQTRILNSLALICIELPHFSVHSSSLMCVFDYGIFFFAQYPTISNCCGDECLCMVSYVYVYLIDLTKDMDIYKKIWQKFVFMLNVHYIRHFIFYLPIHTWQAANIWSVFRQKYAIIAYSFVYWCGSYFFILPSILFTGIISAPFVFFSIFLNALTLYRTLFLT